MDSRSCQVHVNDMQSQPDGKYYYVLSYDLQGPIKSISLSIGDKYTFHISVRVTNIAFNGSKVHVNYMQSQPYGKYYYVLSYDL